LVGHAVFFAISSLHSSAVSSFLVAEVPRLAAVGEAFTAVCAAFATFFTNETTAKCGKTCA